MVLHLGLARELHTTQVTAVWAKIRGDVYEDLVFFSHVFVEVDCRSRLVITRIATVNHAASVLDLDCFAPMLRVLQMLQHIGTSRFKIADAADVYSIVVTAFRVVLSLVHFHVGHGAGHVRTFPARSRFVRSFVSC